MKYDNQLRYATEIIEDYDGKVPLSAWLKDFFRENKQMGSRDRKTISEMVYGFYRIGNNHYPSIEERIIAYLNVAGTLPDMRDYFASKGLISSPPDPGKIFPFSSLLSDGIEAVQFSRSFLVQPDLFIRIRPGNMQRVAAKLQSNQIPYESCGNDCIRLPNSSKIDEILKLDMEAVIQDKSSQRTASLINEAVILTGNENISLWDCCAASGGKSILAYDTIPNINITATDIRESIIANLRRRFEAAGISAYESFVSDVSTREGSFPSSTFDIVLADVPCSGSGTWARTPEQLFFFKEHTIDYYSHLQRKIVSKVITAMKPGAALVYITCSVFRQENELVVEHIVSKHGLHLVRSELIKGYHDKADTMFGAILTNSAP
jgi:16S rRNA (cytosine967-C5)-methyltransferase